VPCPKPSLEQQQPGTGRRSGSKPLHLARRALRWLGGVGKTLESPRENMRVPALHREAERDTTGSIGRQHSVHTWNGGPVQGKRRLDATLIFIQEVPIK
jgi:hypothetical protein